VPRGQRFVVGRIAILVPGRVVIVGLGPAGADHLLPVARAALDAATRRFVRTARHPAVEQLAADGIELDSFDAVYDRAPDLDAVYREMVRSLLVAADDGEDVVYAVPGNPAVAERTVVLLHEAAARGEVAVTVVAGLSFTDLAWSRLGVDPMARDARVVDGRVLEHVVLEGPLLIAQCDNAFVLSDVKLTLLEHLDPATPIAVLQRLGLPDELVTTVELAELDRAVDPDHLTSLFVDIETTAAGAAREIGRLLQLARRLRDPGGCPWDAEQTHHSLTRYLLEESYEVVEAVEALPLEAPGGDVPVPAGAYEALADELGDLFYEVVFHAVLAEEAGGFTMADVARGIHDKLVRRHPHVFGDVVAAESHTVVKNWEQIKLGEKGTTSLVEGITPGLPSLLYTTKLFRKAASIGLDPGNADEAIDRIDLALTRLRAEDLELEDALAQVLAAAVVLARAGGVDAESALRGWAARYRERFQAMERLAADRGLALATLDPAAVTALWLEAVSRG
jgi:tetrapyrrole methylase family protein/MazG family protein